MSPPLSPVASSAAMSRQGRNGGDPPTPARSRQDSADLVSNRSSQVDSLMPAGQSILPAAFRAAAKFESGLLGRGSGASGSDKAESRRGSDRGGDGVRSGHGARVSILRKLETDSPEMETKEPKLDQQPLKPSENLWKATGGYEAVKNFVRKGPALNPALADELEQTVRDEVMGQAKPRTSGNHLQPPQAPRQNAWTDAREISPVRTNWTPRPSTEAPSSRASRSSRPSDVGPRRTSKFGDGDEVNPQRSLQFGDSDGEDQIAPLQCTWRR